MATAEDNAQIIQQAAYELQMFGKLSAETANKLADAKTGITNFNTKMNTATSAMGSLADAFVSYNKVLYEGGSANKANAAALGELGKSAKYAGAFLALLVPGGPLVKGLIAGIGLLAGKFLEAGKIVAEQTDEIYKGFQGLAQAGAAGKGGMQDVFNSLQKVGLGTEKFGEYLKLVNENSKDLATFSGTVLQGRKTFEDTMESLSDGQRVQMEQLGLDRTAQAEATMAYIKQQRMLTMGTKSQMDTSSTAVMRYIKETDELTRITGLNRKEQEKVIEESLRNEAFNATLQEIRETQGDAAAKQVQNAAAMAAKAGPETLKQFQDSLSGFAGASDAATASTLASNGKNLEVAAMFRSGQIKTTEQTAAAMQGLFNALGENAKQFRGQAQMMNYAASGMGNYYERVKAGQYSMDDLVAATKAAEKEQKDQLADKTTEDMAKLENEARNQALRLQKLTNQGMETYISSGKVLSDTNDLLITGFEKLYVIVTNIVKKLSWFLTSEPKVTEVAPAQTNMNQNLEAAANKGYSNLTAEEEQKLNAEMTQRNNEMQLKRFQRMYRKNLEARATGSEERKYEDLEARADGGPVGRGSPYLVGEEGPEIFVPSIAGDIVPLGKLTGTTGAALRQSDRIEKAVKEITLDTIEIEKITDTDAKRAKDYSKFYQTYIELRTTYEKKQMELINYQMNESSGGGGGGAGAAGGSGLQLPAARSIAGMGGGQGLTKMGQGDLAQMGLMIRSADTQAEGAGISPSLIELAKQIQSGVPGFAGFTAFNDKFHNEKAPSSQHTKGLALDFALGEKPSIETGRAITQWLRDSGASLAIDEYNNPSAGATGGHIHAQIPAFAEGGQLGAGRVGIAGEAGPELITGPASITPMNDLTRALDSMSGLLQQSVMKLDEISRATQRNGDINDKMLSYAQN
jgi:hypothetical protein